MKIPLDVSSLSRMMGEGSMDFADRLLKCSDCGTEFVFTAGEQMFFYDKQFKNDPKRCKYARQNAPRWARLPALRRRGAAVVAHRDPDKCSACGIETTVPFKPTQGRPVLCRQCFQMKRVPPAVAAVATMDSPAAQIAAAAAALDWGDESDDGDGCWPRICGGDGGDDCRGARDESAESDAPSGGGPRRIRSWLHRG